MSPFKNFIFEGITKWGWDIILKNIRNIESTNSGLTVKPELDLAWYGSYNGTVNYAINKKGTVYRAKNNEFDFTFATKFTSKDTLIVFFWDKEDKSLGSERVSYKKLAKAMIELKCWVREPYQILDQKITDFVSIQKEGDNLLFLFKNGARDELWINPNDNNVSKKNTIESRINKLEGYGFKIASKVKDSLPLLYPDLFGSKEFILGVDVFLNAEKISKDPHFLAFVKNMSHTETGHNITFNHSSITVHGMIGNLSSGYRSKSFNFEPKEVKDIKSFSSWFKKSGALDYVIELQQAMKGASDSYIAYVKSGGTLD